MSVPSPALKEAKGQSTREDLLQGARFDPYHPRYGLFSFTGTLAIGDDSIGKRTKPKRDSDGKVMTGPINFLTKPVKRGKTNDVYFSTPSFHTVGDRYLDPHLILSRTKPSPSQEDVPPFRPGGAIEEHYSLYSHASVEVVAKQAKKDEDGRVVVGPKGFVVSPPKKGMAGATPNLTFSSFPAVNDPYDRKKELDKKDRIRQNSLIRGDKPFRSNSPGNRDFTSSSEAFGKVTQAMRLSSRVTRSAVFAEHDHPFKPPNPPKSGISTMTIGKYPEHKPDPEFKAPSPPHFENPWRTSYKERTAPTPSVVANYLNLRTEFTALRKK